MCKQKLTVLPRTPIGKEVERRGSTGDCSGENFKTGGGKVREIIGHPGIENGARSEAGENKAMAGIQCHG